MYSTYARNFCSNIGISFLEVLLIQEIWMYQVYIPNQETLTQYVREAVQEYNNRLHHVLDELAQLKSLR
jgi:hypothetical protein